MSRAFERVWKYPEGNQKIIIFVYWIKKLFIIKRGYSRKMKDRLNKDYPSFNFSINSIRIFKYQLYFKKGKVDSNVNCF